MLIVEDEFIIALLIRDMVRELGYGVSGLANNLSAAQAELGKHNFDAVLLDLGLDGQHGSEIADLLMENNVPFAFLTGYTRPFEPRHESVPMLRKPFTAGQLRNVLDELVGTPRQRVANRTAG